MTKKNKFFAVSASAALVASAIVPVAASASVADFNDKDQIADYALPFVEYLVEEGVMSGKGNGIFDPKGNVTRAEAAKMFTVAFDLETTGEKSFSDVKEGAWYTEYVLAAADQGIVNGFENGTFAPQENITRAQAATMISRILGEEPVEDADLSAFVDGESVPAWAKGYVALAVEKGIMKGRAAGEQLFLDWNSNITRQDFAVMFQRTGAVDGMYDQIEDTEEDTNELADALEAMEVALEALAEIELTEENVEEFEAVIEALEAAIAEVEAFESTDETVVNAVEAAKATLEAANAELAELVAQQLATAVEAMTAAEATVAAVTDITKENIETVKADVVVLKEAIAAVEAFGSEDEAVVTSVDAAKVTLEAAKAAIAEFELAPAVAVEKIDTVALTSTVITLKEKPATELTAEDLEVTVNGEVIEVTVAKQAADLTGKSYKLTFATLKGTEGKLVVNGTEKEFDFKAPEYVATKVLDKKTVVVEFNEKIDEETIDYIKFYKGTSAIDGSAVLSADGKSVTVKLATDLTLADYKVVLGTTSGDVADVAGNKIITGAEYSFRPTQAELENVKAPALQTAVYDTARGQLTITLDEKVANLDPSKLAINEVALSGSVISVTDAKATITLTAAQKKALETATAYELTAAKEALVQGTAKSEAFTATVEAVVPAKLTSAAYDENTDVLTLEFDQAVEIDMTKIKYAVANGSGVAFLTDAKVEDTKAKTTWAITLDETHAKTFQDNVRANTKGLKVLLEEGAATVENVANTALAYDKAVVIAYTKDEVLPTMTSASYNDATQKLVVSLSEKISGTTVAAVATNAEKDGQSLNLNFTVGAKKDTLETTVDAATFKALFADNKEVKLTYAKDVLVDVNGNKNTAVTYAEGIVVAFNDFVKPVAETPVAVSSKKVEVTFNEKVEKVSAETVANYAIINTKGEAETISSAQLLQDGKTVVLTLAKDLVDGVTYTASVANVTDLAGNVMKEISDVAFTGVTAVEADLSITSGDTTTIKAIKGEKDEVTLKFSANLDQNTALNADNYVILETKNEAGAEAKEVSLAGAKIEMAGKDGVVITLADNVFVKTGYTYEVTVVNVTDVHGNTFAKDANSIKLTNTGDTTAPVASNGVINQIEGANNDTITLNFDEELAAATLKAENFTLSNVVDAEGTALRVSSVSGAWNEKKTAYVVTLTTGADIVATQATAQVTVSNNVTDVANNAFAGAALNLTFKDATLPTVNKVEFTTVKSSADTISIEFNKAVLEASALDKANYVVKDAQGNVIDLSSANFALTGNKVVITLVDKDGKDINLQNDGTYTVEVKNVVDTLGNKLAATTETAVLSDASDKEIIYTATAASNLVTLSFGEEVVLPELTDLVKVTTTSGETADVKVIYTVANKEEGTIKLTLESALVSGNVNTVEITKDGEVKDLAGNKLTGEALKVTIQ